MLLSLKCKLFWFAKCLIDLFFFKHLNLVVYKHDQKYVFLLNILILDVELSDEKIDT